MNIIFILVEPAVPGNVGASARAINTMGFNDLRLVAPSNHLSEEARMFAHGSNHILEKAIVYPSFSESVKDIDFIIGATAKKRSSNEEYIECNWLSGLLQKKGSTIETVGLVFGREESGLTNEELGQCDLATYIPLANPYPSLNLSQAVMIYAFLLADKRLKSISKKNSEQDKAGLKQLKSKVVNLLDNIEINKNPVLFNRILERIMLLGEDDIHLFHSVLNKLEGKIGE